YGPWLLHLDGTGRTIERVGPFAANSAGHKLPSVLAKRLINKGMEGLTVTPDGSMLVGIMQSALLNGPSVTADTAKQVAMLRVVTYRLIAGGGEAVGATHQFAYLLEVTNAAGNKLASSELTALSNSEFLVNERDGKFPSESGGANKKFWRFTLAGATDISGGDTADGLLLGGLPLEEALFGKTSAQARTTLTGAGITALVKDATPLLDLVGTLGGQYAHDKVEGVVFSGGHIIISNDDDFGINGSGTVTAKTIPGSLPLGNLPGTATGPLTTDYSQLLELDPAKLATATGTVTVTVAANSAPTIGTVADTTILEDTATGALAVTVGDAETPVDGLVLTATSDNPALLPAGGIVVGGSGAARTITLTPAANQNGHALVTVTVTDAHGGTASSTFTLTVTPVNDAPVAADGTLAAVAGVPANGTLVATDIDSATLTYAVVGAPATGTIVLDAGTGAYVYTAPAATPAGTVTFTFKANDGALNSNVATVTVTVAAAPPGEHHDDDKKKKCGRGSGVMALVLGLFALIRLGLWRRRR
ncbi:MAG: esterase-like activity of phytase family protein, partial [Planctomycetes bacterium]|nr:esterase-like activity of phytase family protein [Planctomycetota bacterium]